MKEIINIEEILYSTKFAVLSTLEDYQDLNNKIGIAKSYPDEKSDTYFYSNPEPESINVVYYMEITKEIQELYPQVLEGIILIDRVPEVITEETINN